MNNNTILDKEEKKTIDYKEENRFIGANTILEISTIPCRDVKFAEQNNENSQFDLLPQRP